MQMVTLECCKRGGGEKRRIKNRESSRGKKTKLNGNGDGGIAFVLFLFLLNKNRLNRTGSHLIDCTGSTGIFNHSHDHCQLKLFRFMKAHQLPNLPLDK